jgi:hypothetical protein
VAAGVPGDEDSHNAALSTACNYLRGDLGVKQTAVAIPTNLGHLDNPAPITNAQLETLFAVATTDITIDGNPRTLCVPPANTPHKIAALETQMTEGDVNPPHFRW